MRAASCAGGALLPETRAPAPAWPAHAGSADEAYRVGEAVLLRTASRLVPSFGPAGAAGLEERWVPARVRAVRPEGGYDLEVTADGAPQQRAGVAAADLRRPPANEAAAHLPAAMPGAPRARTAVRPYQAAHAVAQEPAEALAEHGDPPASEQSTCSAARRIGGSNRGTPWLGGLETRFRQDDAG